MYEQFYGFRERPFRSDAGPSIPRATEMHRRRSVISSMPLPSRKGITLLDRRSGHRQDDGDPRSDRKAVLRGPSACISTTRR